MSTAYFQSVAAALCRYPHDNADPKAHIKIAYTAMHGVGHAFTSRLFEAFRLPPYVQVDAQIHPDPDFPTVNELYIYICDLHTETLCCARIIIKIE